MAAVSDAVVIGIVLGLVFAAVSYYLYTRVSQLERKVSLMENILLDLKVTTEQTLLSAYNEPLHSSEEELASYQTIAAEAAEEVSDVNGSGDGNGSGEESSNEMREVHLEQAAKSKTSVGQVQVERTEKSSVSVNYEAMTYKELVALAKQNGISGIRNLSKAQLIDALRRRSSGADESKQMELSSWTAASGTVSFTEKQEEVDLAGAQEEDHQTNLLSSMEQFESSMDQLDQLTSFVQ